MGWRSFSFIYFAYACSSRIYCRTVILYLRGLFSLRKVYFLRHIRQRVFNSSSESGA